MSSEIILSEPAGGHNKMTSGVSNTEEARQFDLISVGFGVAGISNAVALQERGALTNALFLEEAPRESWKLCSNSPSDRLTASFLNDLITMENPRSTFTFLNYLHETNKLVFYANSSHINPSRQMFEEYLTWCAAKIDAQVEFGKTVTTIVPIKNSNRQVESWRIVFRDSFTREERWVTAKQVVYATSGRTCIPEALRKPDLSHLVCHSSEYLDKIPGRLQRSVGKPRFAIIGDGQEAADIFEHLHSIRGAHEVVWYTRDPLLRATNEGPFALSAIMLPGSKTLQLLPPELRHRATITHSEKGSHSTIDPELLKRIYEIQYAQSVKEPFTDNWQFQIKYGHDVAAAHLNNEGRISATFRNLQQSEPASSLILDGIVAATGYQKNVHAECMAPVSDLLDAGVITVDRDYQLNMKANSLAEGCGLWLQGSLAEGETEEIAYTTIAEKSRRLADSLVRNRTRASKGIKGEDRTARL